MRGLQKGRQTAKKLQTFPRRHIPPKSRHQPTPADPGPVAGQAGGRRGQRGARPRPAAPGNFRAKPSAAPLPGNRPGRGTSPGVWGPGTFDPRPKVAGERAGLGNVQGHGGGRPADPRPSGTSPLSRGTPGAKARPAPALRFQLPPGLLNFGGRKSRPRVASPGGAPPQALAGYPCAGPGAGADPRAVLGRCGAVYSLCEGGNRGPGRLPPHPACSPRDTSSCGFVIHLFAGCLLLAGHYA